MNTKKTIKNIKIKNDLDYVYVSLASTDKTYREIANACDIPEQYLKSFPKRYLDGHDFSFKIVNRLAEYFRAKA